MNIALQLLREDFPKNFCATLSHFLSWRDGRQYDVKWNGPARRRTAVLYLHSRLGIATPKWADPRRFAFIWRELRGGKSPLESLARRAYLAAHLLPGPSRPLLAENHVTIEPAPPRFGDGFYVPGGNQLRWFDPANGRCYVTLKRGFPARTFTAQIDLRARFELPAPRLLEVDRDAEIFCEEIVPGRTRIDATPAERDALAARALAALAPLAEATSIATTVAEYAAGLVASIAESAAGLETDLQREVTALAARLAGNLKDGPLETVLAHGDISLGHILDAGDRVVLVDWEHTARRQRNHDALTLELRPQLPAHFSAALGRGPLVQNVALLVLESLDFASRESDNRALRGPTQGLLNLLAGQRNRS